MRALDRAAVHRDVLLEVHGENGLIGRAVRDSRLVVLSVFISEGSVLIVIKQIDERDKKLDGILASRTAALEILTLGTRELNQQGSTMLDDHFRTRTRLSPEISDPALDNKAGGTVRAVLLDCARDGLLDPVPGQAMIAHVRAALTKVLVDLEGVHSLSECGLAERAVARVLAPLRESVQLSDCKFQVLNRGVAAIDFDGPVRGRVRILVEQLTEGDELKVFDRLPNCWARRRRRRGTRAMKLGMATTGGVGLAANIEAKCVELLSGEQLGQQAPPHWLVRVVSRVVLSFDGDDEWLQIPLEHALVDRGHVWAMEDV